MCCLLHGIFHLVYTQNFRKILHAYLINDPHLIRQSCLLLSFPRALIPPNNYMFKVNNRNTRIRCKICSKLTIKTPKRRHWRLSGVFIINFKHILNIFVNFKQVNTGWESWWLRDLYVLSLLDCIPLVVLKNWTIF